MAIRGICSIPDCGKPHKGKGFCVVHYMRFRKHGDPSVVKTGPRGEIMEYFQSVVLTYEGEECLMWPYGRNNGGYGSIFMEGQMRRVSRLSCEEQNGPPPTPRHHAAHSCGKGHLGCVAKRHLSWKTPKENSADKTIHGTQDRGENHPNAKLTERQVREIRSLLGKEPQKSIAERFGLRPSTISNIRHGRDWAWLDNNTSDINTNP